MNNITATLLSAAKGVAAKYNPPHNSHSKWFEIFADLLEQGVCSRCLFRLSGHQNMSEYAAPQPPAHELVQCLRQQAGACGAAKAAPDKDSEPSAAGASSSTVTGGKAAEEAPGSTTEHPLAQASTTPAAAQPPCRVCPACCGALQLLDGPIASSSSESTAMQIESNACVLGASSAEAAAGEASTAADSAGAATAAVAPGTSPSAAATAAAEAAEAEKEVWANVRMRAIQSATRIELGNAQNKPLADLRPDALAALLQQATSTMQYGTFGVDVALPSSFIIRDNIMYSYINQLFPNTACKGWAVGSMVPVKSVLRRVVAGHVQSVLQKAQMDATNADVCLVITLAHPSDAQLLTVLARDQLRFTQQREQQKHRSKRQARGAGPPPEPKITQRHLDELNYEVVIAKLNKMPRWIVLKLWPWPLAPALQAEPVQPAARVARAPLLLAGRYRKLKRHMPQCPWFNLNTGERIGGVSLQEHVERFVLPLYGARDAKFISGGREDADVRMLGTGRPFVLEILEPQRPHPSAEELRAAEEAMRDSGCGADVLGLAPADKSCLDKIKAAEDSKQKTYRAVCWCSRELGEADMAGLVARVQELTVMQDTPVRVLHRRAPKLRPKTFTVEQATLVPGRANYFTVQLRTQAGAYVKEFCHGDFGRCRPHLGDLLADPASGAAARTEILQLDVLEVHMPDWP